MAIIVDIDGNLLSFLIRDNSDGSTITNFEAKSVFVFDSNQAGVAGIYLGKYNVFNFDLNTGEVNYTWRLSVLDTDEELYGLSIYSPSYSVLFSRNTYDGDNINSVLVFDDGGITKRKHLIYPSGTDYYIFNGIARHSGAYKNYVVCGNL